MSFVNSKWFKILNVVNLAVLLLIVMLNIIMSFVALPKVLFIIFIILICLGACFVIAYNIFSMIAVSKYNKSRKN